MKHKTLLGVLIALAVAGLARGASATNSGPGTLHYVTHNNLTNSLSNVVATLKLDYYDKGNGILQKLDIAATNLAPRTTYSLIAALGDDPLPVIVAPVTTDKKGKLRISYLDLPNGGGSGGNTNKALPAAINPLLAMRGLGLADVSGQTVAFAWLATPTLCTYQVKRNLTRVDPFGTAAGSIDLRSNITGANFKLKADGLPPANIFLLSLNSNIVNTAASDLKGRVQIIGWSFSAPTCLGLRSLELLDGASNAVLTTSFP
jgi:hypothetical protein